MPFSSPVVGGTTLVRDAINSPNYVAGSTGWAIKADGTAEFHGVTITGGNLVVTQAGQGVFIYNGAPALGNLMISISPVAGTDAWGNAYPAGESLNGVIVLDPATSTITAGSQTTGARVVIDGANYRIRGYDSLNTNTVSLDGTTAYVGAQSSNGAFAACKIAGTQAQLQVCPPTVAGITWNTGAYVAGYNSPSAPNQPYGVLFSPKDNAATKQSSIQLTGGKVGADTSIVEFFADKVTFWEGITFNDAQTPFKIAYGTSVGTTNASGDYNLGAAIWGAAAAFTTQVLWALFQNGDGNARANVTMAAMSNPNSNSWNVRTWVGSTGAVVAGAAVRWDWIALGI